MSATTSHHRIIRARELMATVGLAKTATYAHIRDGLLPPPVQLSRRAVGWPAQEIDAVIAARIAGRPESDIRALVARLVAARGAAQ